MLPRIATRAVPAAALAGLLMAGGAVPAQAQTPATPPTPPPAITYTCQDGTIVVARFPDSTTALISFGTDRYELNTTPSGSGVRYAGADVVFWTHQGDARLERGSNSTECKGPR